VAEAVGEVNEITISAFQALTKTCGSGLARQSNLDEGANCASTG
jgi:hypothetical protein